MSIYFERKCDVRKRAVGDHTESTEENVKFFMRLQSQMKSKLNL